MIMNKPLRFVDVFYVDGTALQHSLTTLTTKLIFAVKLGATL